MFNKAFHKNRYYYVKLIGKKCLYLNNENFDKIKEQINFECKKLICPNGDEYSLEWDITSVIFNGGPVPYQIPSLKFLNQNGFNFIF